MDQSFPLWWLSSPERPLSTGDNVQSVDMPGLQRSEMELLTSIFPDEALRGWHGSCHMTLRFKTQM